MKSKGLLVLTALLGTGLVLGSCGDPTTSGSSGEEASSITSGETSSSEDTSSEAPAIEYTATKVTINSKCPSKATVGETIDFDEYVTVSSPEGGTYGLRVRDGSTGAATIDGHKVTITRSGSIGIQIVGAADANLRLWTITAVSAEARELADYLSALSYNYTLKWDDSSSKSIYGMTYHNENYWLALDTIDTEEDLSASKWTFWGAIQAGEYRYEVNFYEDYDFVNGTVSYSYDVMPGIFDDSLYYAAAEMSFNENTISTDPETGLTLISETGVSAILQTGAGSSYSYIKTNLLEPAGFAQAYLLPYNDDATGELLGVELVLCDAQLTPFSSALISNAGTTNFKVLDDFVAAGIAPDYKTNEAFAEFLGGKAAEKASTTIEATISYGVYGTDQETGEAVWYDASLAGAASMESLGILDYAPAGTYSATVNETSYYATGTLNGTYYVSTDPFYMAVGQDSTDGHYYRVTGTDPEAWDAKEDLGADFNLWNPNGIVTIYDQEYGLTGTEYLTTAPFTADFLDSLPYTSVKTEGDIIYATVDAVKNQGKIIEILAGMVPYVGSTFVAGVLNGLTYGGNPIYTIFDSPTIAYNTTTGEINFETVLPGIGEDATLGTYVGVRLQVTLSNFGATEVPSFGFTVASTEAGETA